jgi:hypothetical protein
MIYYYRQYPDSIHTIIALYWIQSVFIGLFNFVDIITLKKVVSGGLKMNNKRMESKGCAGSFFLFHYGFFHLAYLFFLITIIDHKKIDWTFMQIGFWLIIASHAISFIQHKIRYNTIPGNLANMFFLPYLRIIPMHLMIIVPAFLNVSSYMLFLILKTIFDLLMYIISYRMMFKAEGGN